MKHWLAAIRLKTLPLAIGAIILGSTLHQLRFDFDIFLFACLTAICLQILSNLANDYGDFVKGTDAHRTDRQMAGGHISEKAMKIAIGFLILLSLSTGIYLLFLAFGNNWHYWWKFFGIGVLSILAAISYTVGKKAYGYYGLGDLFVFIFFGLVGVMGTAFLYKQEPQSDQWFAAVAYGLMCVGVLNVNNIRDLDKDVLANKITFASKLGRDGAIIYQGMLLSAALFCILIHHFLGNYLSLAPLALGFISYVHLKNLQYAETATHYNAQLKFLSLGSLFVVILFLLRLYI